MNRVSPGLLLLRARSRDKPRSYIWSAAWRCFVPTNKRAGCERQNETFFMAFNRVW